MNPTPFGRYIRDSRLAADRSLRVVADGLGVTHAYYAEVERGKRRTLPERYWPMLVAVIPGITIDELTKHARNSAQLMLDMPMLTPDSQDLAHALARRITSESPALSRNQISQILRILGGDDDE